MYLSKEEYVALNLGTVPDNYEQLERRAEIELNRITRSFYLTTDLTDDVEWRREPFKLAMAFQINHPGILAKSLVFFLIHQMLLVFHFFKY